MEVKRGFKQTDIGFIPVDWEITKLQNLATDIGDGIHTTPIYIDNSEYYFINGNNLNNGKIQINENTKCVALNEYNKHFVKLGKKSILLSINGTIGNLAYFNNENVILGKSAAYINLIDELNKEYFFYVLDSNSIKNYFENELTGTTIRNLSLLSLRNTPIPLPALPEQQAIAEALSDMDALIAAQEALIAKKRAIKQGVMQELLTGKRRLPGFSGEWKIKKLGEIADIKTGEKNNDDKIADGEFPFFVRSQTIERINTFSFDGEAILVPGEGNIGRIFHYINGKFDYHQRVYKISDFLPNVCGKFIYFVMCQMFNEHAMRNSVKATVDSLRLPTFQKFELLISDDVKEQEKIAEILTEFDQEIFALEEKLKKTKSIKQGMLQELLTGRIRLM